MALDHHATDRSGHGAPLRIGILTSGGDAQGMNAAVRAVVRTAISRGAEVYAIYEGYQGMIDGGDRIRRFGWEDVGSILNKGGTTIGTFRSKEFRERSGRLRAARNLLLLGIDRIVVIGGDGSLSGLDLFRAEWPGLLAELVETGEIAPQIAEAHPTLMIAGLVGSIDNDLVGTDMTIGADSALHRIVDAIDALASTAASHQRSFVVEVMGRHCGYLALMSAIAGGCDYVLIPEHPPADGWEDRMCAELRRGRAAGRRDSIVIVAEGARDRAGNPITSEYVRQVIERELDEDTRVTILGHVQRGGVPSAFDRWASTWLGYTAAEELLAATPDSEANVIGIRGNRMSAIPLVEAVRQTREVAACIERADYEEAMALRGSSFTEMTKIFRELAEPSRVDASDCAKRIAIVHAGGLAPGMNTAARAAVRLGISRGHTMLGVRNGFHGLRDGEIEEMDWGTVEGWTADGGAELGVRRSVPKLDWLYSISRSLEEHRVDALLVIGGWNAYESAHLLYSERERYPSFTIPIVCVPASIDNNLPGSELSIGCDTALNVLVEAIDRLKLSGSATKRAFVVETMGRYCGYLALMSGLAGGAERVYLHEDGVQITDLVRDIAWLRESFAAGRRLFLAVRNENASENYTTDFMARLLREEGGDLFDVRQAVIGHIQQGGSPTPFDRLFATRLTSHAINLLGDELAAGTSKGYYVGLMGSKVGASPIAHMMEHMDKEFRRPLDQWWLALRDVSKAVAGEAH
ncbi:MAG: 6-phosphofructokinase [Micrococcales bacterium 73-15]|uniref:6-phosphofructokinase n=1 Tax=Salana multivorans TaxID=120377 RepID=UPI00096680B0|nr:6-phosphofructokinase [Salana multivorans]OJX94323.1 MAG: 6-phosphofructokinase [Micrococcales bacterium 73-15]